MNLFQRRNITPMIFQSEMGECGLACLAMIAARYGKQSDISTLREKFSLSAAGASVQHLLLAANVMELGGRALKLELNEINSLALPVVLHWDLDHFVVLAEVSKNSVIIHDPAKGIRKYSRDELSLHFSGIAIEFRPSVTFKREVLSPRYSLAQLLQPSAEFYRTVFQVFVLSFFVQALALLTPLYMQLVIDQGLSKADRDIVFLIALLFSLVLLAKAVVSYFRGILLLQFSNSVGFQIVGDTFRHLLQLPLSFFERRGMGDIVSRFSSLEKIKNMVTQELITVVVDGLFSLVTLLILILYSPVLAGLALCFTSIYVIIQWLVLPYEKNRRQEVLVSGATQQTHFMESIRNITTSKTYGIEQGRFSDWQNRYAVYINSGYHLAQFQLRIGSIQSLVLGLDHIVTIYIATGLVHTGQLSLGQFISFIFLKQHFSSAIAAMLPKLAEIRLLRLELDRISDISTQKVQANSPLTSLFRPTIASHPIQGKLEIRDLCFRYSKAEEPVIKALTVTLEPGESLAVTGKSGCGKSTLLKLILGLEQADSGNVCIDGRKLITISPVLFREKVAAILHGDGLLAGTLAYNIHLDLKPWDEQGILDACKLARIDQVIVKLPMGLNTRIGELGTLLSAGQIQRVLIARALYRQPRILVLDESFSNLGDEMSVQLLQNMIDLNITLIVVTHNPKLQGMANKQLKM